MAKPEGMSQRTWDEILAAADRFPKKRFEPEGAEFMGISPSDQAWFLVTGIKRYTVEAEDTGLFAGLPETKEEPDSFFVQIRSSLAIRESCVDVANGVVRG